MQAHSCHYLLVLINPFCRKSNEITFSTHHQNASTHTQARILYTLIAVCT